MNPVVVLGSTGLLGQALLREAARRGLPTVGISRRSGVDLSRVHSLDTLLDPLLPRLVINAAAMTDLGQCESRLGEAHAINARLPGVLAAWCARRDVPWIQVSTDHFHAGPANVLHTEAEPVTLLNEYAATKYAGEAYALAHPDALVVRTNIVGSRGWPGRPTFGEWAVAALRSGRPFDAYDDVWASSLSVDQFAPALFDLHATGARGLVNLAARDAQSKAELILGLARALDLDAAHCRVVHRPAGVHPRRANAMGLDVARAERLLGRRLPEAGDVIRALARTFEDAAAHAHA